MTKAPTFRAGLVVTLIGLLVTSLLIAVAPRATAGTAVVFEETFEDGSIAPEWAVNDTEPLAGQDYWGITQALNHTGRYSAWCAQIGNQSSGPNAGLNNSDVFEYDDDMQADLVVDLRVDGYTSLNLSFYYYAKTESGGGDWIQAWYEAGGTQYVIFNPRGSTGNNWDFATVSVPNDVEKLIVRFHSDGANHGFEGALVDDIVLTGVEFVPPTSSLTTTPTFSNAVPYQVPYAAQDNANASGVAYVELWYRNRTSGPFILYTSPLNLSGRWTTSTIPFDATLVGGDGYYEFYTLAVDRAGNAEPPPAGPDGNVTIDTTRPNLLIVSPDDGAEFRTGDVTVEWSGSDALSGIARFETSVDGGPFDSVGPATSRAFTGLTPGDHTVVVRAVDRAGNVREESVTVTILAATPGEFPWLLLALVLAIVIAGVLFFIWWKRSKDKEKSEVAKVLSPEPKAPPPDRP